MRMRVTAASRRISSRPQVEWLETRRLLSSLHGISTPPHGSSADREAVVRSDDTHPPADTSESERLGDQAKHAHVRGADQEQHQNPNQDDRPSQHARDDARGDLNEGDRRPDRGPEPSSDGGEPNHHGDDSTGGGAGWKTHDEEHNSIDAPQSTPAGDSMAHSAVHRSEPLDPSAPGPAPAMQLPAPAATTPSSADPAVIADFTDGHPGPPQGSAPTVQAIPVLSDPKVAADVSLAPEGRHLADQDAPTLREEPTPAGTEHSLLAAGHAGSALRVLPGTGLLQAGPDLPNVPAETGSAWPAFDLVPQGSGPDLPEVSGAGYGLLAGMLPFDRTALEQALQDFLTSFETLGQDLGRSLGGLGLSPWLWSLALAATAYEVSRRQKRMPAVRVGLAGGLAATHTWVTGLPGSLSTEEP
jgi:hypothetical protein